MKFISTELRISFYINKFSMENGNQIYNDKIEKKIDLELHDFNTNFFFFRI